MEAGTQRQRFRGDKLQASREALKYVSKGKKGSQAWLAFRIGAHVTSVSDWERGSNEPSSRYAAAICAVPELGLSMSDLFGSDDDEESDPVADLMRALDRYVDHRSAAKAAKEKA